jgi:hypothetical protein
MKKATDNWRKLHDEEFHYLNSSPNIITMFKWRMMRWAGHVARMWEMRNAYRISVGKPEGTRPLGRPRLRWEDNIKMNKNRVCGRDWIHVCGPFEHGPLDPIKNGTFLDLLKDSASCSWCWQITCAPRCSIHVSRFNPLKLLHASTVNSRLSGLTKGRRRANNRKTRIIQNTDTDRKVPKNRYCSTTSSVDPPRNNHPRPPKRSRKDVESPVHTCLRLCKKKSCTDNPQTGKSAHG